MIGERTRLGLWRPQSGWPRAAAASTSISRMHVDDSGYDRLVARLRDRGHEVEEHVFDTYEESRAAYVKDPDGNVVELWTWDVANHLLTFPDASRSPPGGASSAGR